MVVLEGGGMLSTSANQYLQPDYLSPLPTTLDAKKSPLALLAQTCSQIGADIPNSKTLIPPIEKKKSTNSGSENTKSPQATNLKMEKPRSTPENKHLAFKPYEVNVFTKKSDDTRPSSKASVDSLEERKSGKSTPGRKSSTPANVTPTPDTGKSSPGSADRKTSSPSGSSGRGASPIIRSGLEVLQGHPKDHLAAFKHGNLPGLQGMNPLNPLCCPPGMENPAFRPPFAGGPFSHHHAAMLAAAGFSGASPNPYLSYARIKTSSGGETLVPVCKDPYCTGCQFSLHNQQMLLAGAGPCPSGCTQCDHQKYNLAMAMALSPAGAAGLPYSQIGRPYVCNWIAGESYCGKRFGNSEELLQHLRSHTADSGASAVTSQSSLLNPMSPLFSTATALHRAAAGYPSGPLSPLSAARFHPYAKPGLAGSPGLGASPYSAFNPAALGPYYSPYAMYGQRIGAAVHQ